ncbi:MAG TPA: DUF493 family protein [Bacteroidia bacterium]|jgi:putative lipoic acid-binding regulatory protein|nr:DUF493 family protein [Bacteroidia bacterium]
MNNDWSDLKSKLSEYQTFPSIYMFKFILSSNNQKIAQLEALFNNNSADISIRQSSRGRYVSITVKQLVNSVDEIISIYQQASQISGVMII